MIMDSKPDRPNIDNILNYAESNPDAVTLGEDGLARQSTLVAELSTWVRGFGTYSGTQNPDYDGPFSELVNRPRMMAAMITSNRDHRLTRPMPHRV